MLLNSDDLEIQHLADNTGVSVRTIRFYQQEGLMPAPGTRGRAVRYGEADLKRLRLIKALQAERLTLAEIRDRIAPMGDQEVTRELDSLGTSRRSAASYARSVLDSVGEEIASYAATQRRSTPARSTYDRITITPGIELHVRGPMSQFEHTLLLQLLREADRIFHTKTRERL